MMLRVRAWGLWLGMTAVLGAVGVSACEGDPDDDRVTIRPGGGGSTMHGGPGGATNQVGAPLLELIFEGGAPDLENPATSSLVLRCSVEAADDEESSAVDSSTIRFRLLRGEEEVLAQDGALVEGESDLYETEFATSTLTSGEYTAECQASTIAAMPLVGVATQKVVIDAGPNVELLSPEAESALSTIKPQRFEFKVSAAPLAKDDPGAEVASISVSVSGQTFEAQAVPDAEDTYFVNIDFSDTVLFPTTPNGSKLVTISATNSRTPSPTTRSLTTEFILDGEGPLLTLVSPADTAIIGGTVNIEFTASDALSGVDFESLVVELNEEEYAYNTTDGRWRLNDNKVRFEFESAEVSGSVIQTNVQVSGRDKAGNEASVLSALYWRDEEGPIVTLTPPLFRERKSQAGKLLCSHAFEPTGSATRGGLVDDVVLFRAVIWDRTNRTTGQKVFHWAGIDQDTAELWVRRADSPLLRDTTGDGQCDDIISTGAKVQALTALAPTGLPFYGDGTGDSAQPPLVGCDYAATSPSPSKTLCGETSDLAVVAHHASGEPVVYAVNPMSSTVECTGAEWELPSAGLTDYQGWVCAAVRAVDNVGNRSVSPPVALCLDNSSVAGVPACASDLGNPPNCRDGCSMPDDFEGGVIYDD